MIKELLQMLIEYKKEQRQLKKDVKLIQSYELSYEALERIVILAQQGGTPIEMKLTFPDGKVLEIKPKVAEVYKSFAQRYAESHA